jgi:uncharacterized protein (TIGR02996 family)
MAVHFVYRSHYQWPAGLRRQQFADATVLDWFRNHWWGITYENGAHERAAELLGMDVYGFGSLFMAIAEHQLPPPRTNRDLAAVLREHLYVEGEIRCAPHAVQVLTDDDEIQMAYYIFDDEYLAKHRDRAAFFLNEGWQLPASAGERGFKPAEKTDSLEKGSGEGATYFAVNEFWDSCNLDEVCVESRIDGVRLPQLAKFLSGADRSEKWGPGYTLSVLASQLFPKGKKAKRPEDPFLFAIRDNPDDDAPWLIFNDWLMERGERSAGAFILERALREVSRCVPGEYGGWKFNPKKSLVQVEEHVAAFCRHVARWGKTDLYHQWYVFDDLWASAHPDLANAILRYASRWDVL